jgi:hypothetical protein
MRNQRKQKLRFPFRLITLVSLLIRSYLCSGSVGKLLLYTVLLMMHWVSVFPEESGVQGRQPLPECGVSSQKPFSKITRKDGEPMHFYALLALEISF